MAWIRKVKLSVGAGGQGLDISNLDISFQINRSITSSFNDGIITVYNAKESTRNDILKKGNSVILKAGYNDEGIGTIFSGVIIESVTNFNDTEWVTEIKAIDIGNNKNGLEFEVFQFSYKKDTPFITVLNDVSNSLNLNISGLSNVTETLKDGFSYGGNIKGLLNQIKGILKLNNKDLYFDNNEMVIFNIGNRSSKFEVVRITEKSGLIGNIGKTLDENTKKTTINFTTLLNYKIQPNGLMNINTQKVKGNYYVDKVVFTGDNMGGDFFSEVEASE